MNKNFIIGMSVLAVAAMTTIKTTPVFAGPTEVKGSAAGKADVQQRLSDISERTRVEEMVSARATTLDAKASELTASLKSIDPSVNESALRQSLKLSIVINKDGAQTQVPAADVAAKMIAMDKYLKNLDVSKLSKEDQAFVSSSRSLIKTSIKFLSLNAKSGAGLPMSQEQKLALEIYNLQALVVTKIGSTVGGSELEAHDKVMKSVIEKAADPNKNTAQATLEVMQDLAKDSGKDVAAYMKDVLQKLIDCLKLLGLIK